MTFLDPRFGVVFDVNGDERTAVKAHWGRYHDKMYTYLFDREVSGNAVIPDQDFYWVDGEGYTDCDVPTVQMATMGETNHPYVEETVATFEQPNARGGSLERFRIAVLPGQRQPHVDILPRPPKVDNPGRKSPLQTVGYSNVTCSDKVRATETLRTRDRAEFFGIG